MKKILIMTILTLTFIITILVSNAKSNQLIYTEVVAVPDVNKQALFQRANIWAVSAFNNAKTAIQVNDKESGQIIGKSALKYRQSFIGGSNNTLGYINFVFKIFIKDGRYKYEFSEFVHEASLSTSGLREDFGLITEDKEYQGKMVGVGFLKPSKSWVDDVWKDMKIQIEREILYGAISSLKEVMINKGDKNNDNW
ncbi:MAG: hypothetical protein CVU54_03925 [Deltaproteobacteria bacterium HGW-Deltaproteobacteria-12]|jgi:hypothetical protein|nr:MAG: hypothetical protein CVU54_03925 [Deltaproteobacteria bacterium HGW-Deltaproteobacteria-12]